MIVAPLLLFVGPGRLELISYIEFGLGMPQKPLSRLIARLSSRGDKPIYSSALGTVAIWVPRSAAAGARSVVSHYCLANGLAFVLLPQRVAWHFVAPNLLDKIVGTWIPVTRVGGPFGDEKLRPALAAQLTVSLRSDRSCTFGIAEGNNSRAIPGKWDFHAGALDIYLGPSEGVWPHWALRRQVDGLGPLMVSRPPRYVWRRE